MHATTTMRIPPGECFCSRWIAAPSSMRGGEEMRRSSSITRAIRTANRSSRTGVSSLRRPARSPSGRNSHTTTTFSEKGSAPPRPGGSTRATVDPRRAGEPSSIHPRRGARRGLARGTMHDHNPEKGEAVCPPRETADYPDGSMATHRVAGGSEGQEPPERGCRLSLRKAQECGGPQRGSKPRDDRSREGCIL